MVCLVSFALGRLSLDVEVNRSGDQGAHCRPWTPASLSLCSFSQASLGTAY